MALLWLLKEPCLIHTSEDLACLSRSVVLPHSSFNAILVCLISFISLADHPLNTVISGEPNVNGPVARTGIHAAARQGKAVCWWGS
jgi:hypothetical protein